MDNNLKRCCAITGYRPKSFPWKYDETAPGCIKLKEVLTEQITALTNSGVTEWFSGMALGADHYCSQIILTLRKENPALRLHCVLPCEGQADDWSESAREQYYFILERADSMEYVSRTYHCWLHDRAEPPISGICWSFAGCL